MSDEPTAFPQSLSPEGPFGGMSLRDYFAAQVVGAVVRIVSAGQHGPAGETSSLKFIASTAYDIADAMLEHREKAE